MKLGDKIINQKIILILSAVLLSACASTSPEVFTKIKENGLTPEQVCIDNGIYNETAQRCNSLKPITDEYVNHSIQLQKQKDEFNKAFLDNCEQIKGKMLESDTVCYSRLTGSSYSIKQEPYTHLLEKAAKEQLRMRAQWIKEAEGITTVANFCEYVHGQYSASKDTCTPSQSPQNADKYNTVLPIIENTASTHISQWQQEAKSYQGNLRNLCTELSKEYDNNDQPLFYVSYDCLIRNSEGQLKYNTMKPFLMERQKQDSIAQIADEKAKAAALAAKRKTKDAEFQAEWDAKKSTTVELKAGKSYQCEHPFYGKNFHLELGNQTALLNNYQFNFIEQYQNFALYRGVNNDGTQLITLKVLSKSGINGGYYNLLFDEQGLNCQ